MFSPSESWIATLLWSLRMCSAFGTSRVISALWTGCPKNPAASNLPLQLGLLLVSGPLSDFFQLDLSLSANVFSFRKSGGFAILGWCIQAGHTSGPYCESWTAAKVATVRSLTLILLLALNSQGAGTRMVVVKRRSANSTSIQDATPVHLVPNSYHGGPPFFRQDEPAAGNTSCAHRPHHHPAPHVDPQMSSMMSSASL
ncbi:hypothetical protein FB45DRAFT_885522 [Roridomyces roridus]|uniref:Secreted protein n=1 Tax=Roridomyces roridus TaxID=1738132 RepID=A0AAD7CHV7_9AGAR|nr:hypothetical protein FB45DRAFT_885522 [Roridomyces roridus]